MLNLSIKTVLGVRCGAPFFYFISMKKYIATLLLTFICAFSQAVAETNENDLGPQVRSGFYFSTGLTFGYSYYRDHYVSGYNEKWEYFENYVYDAFVLYGEARLGRSFSNVFSVYGILGLGLGPASLEYSEEGPYSRDKKAEYSASCLRLALGAGAEFYPVQNQESWAYGLFLGVAVGFAYETVHYDTQHEKSFILSYGSDLDKDGMPSFFARVEAGKDWWIGKGRTLGVAVNWTIGSFELEGDNKDYKYDVLTHLIGLTIRYTR